MENELIPFKIVMKKHMFAIGKVTNFYHNRQTIRIYLSELFQRYYNWHRICKINNSIKLFQERIINEK